MLCSSSHLDKKALNAEELDAAYVKYAVLLKPCGKTTHFKGGSREAYRVLHDRKLTRLGCSTSSRTKYLVENACSWKLRVLHALASLIVKRV